MTVVFDLVAAIYLDGDLQPNRVRFDSLLWSDPIQGKAGHLTACMRGKIIGLSVHAQAYHSHIPQDDLEGPKSGIQTPS